jgi:glycerol-3-phosphate acyltransferase PlsX
MITIALDAMGSDNAPKPEIEGAVQAVIEHDVRLLLVGREDVIRAELSSRHRDWQSLPIEIRNASEVIGMDESAAKSVRAKKDSSLRVASRLVKDGEAQGMVSAGNTGAVMVAAKMVQGMVPGVDRPALAAVFPTVKGKPCVMVDVGANVDCEPKMLAQFALMGELYSRAIFHVRHPRVGILSNGEEDEKGNALVKAARPLIQELKHLNFIGNVEGRDLYSGIADVIVCDGFIGNVALKVSEGLAEAIKTKLKESLSSTITRQIGSVLAKNGFEEFKKGFDYSEYGGAPLLGVKGVCIISHGRSNGNAIKNAVRVAAEYARGRVNERIEEELSRIKGA